MKRDLKTLFLNIIAGIISYYVVKFLDTNNLPVLSYSVFVLYLVFIFSASYFHFKQSKKPIVAKDNCQNKPDKDVTDDKEDIVHNILKTVVKLTSQHVDATPNVVAEKINEDPQIVLAYLQKMVDEHLVVFTNEGKPPTIDVPFFVAYHENPWKKIKIQKR